MKISRFELLAWTALATPKEKLPIGRNKSFHIWTQIVLATLSNWWEKSHLISGERLLCHFILEKKLDKNDETPAQRQLENLINKKCSCLILLFCDEQQGVIICLTAIRAWLLCTNELNDPERNKAKQVPQLSTRILQHLFSHLSIKNRDIFANINCIKFSTYLA